MLDVILPDHNLMKLLGKWCKKYRQSHGKSSNYCSQTSRLPPETESFTQLLLSSIAQAILQNF